MSSVKVVHTCYLATREVDTGRPEVQCHPWLHIKFEAAWATRRRPRESKYGLLGFGEGF